MNLASFDKKQNNGKVNFSAVMEVEARIFTTSEGKNDYSATTDAAKKPASANAATHNPYK